MDNGTHSLLGAALAKTRLGRLHPLAPISLLIGVNLPDADFVVALFGGKNAYLIHHRGITHSLLGVVIEALLLASVMRAVELRRARATNGDPERRRSLVNPDAPIAPSGWMPYAWPALVGLFSHPLLDSLNNFGVRPWLPFSDARYFGDLVFIVDPWLWCLFGGTALLAGARTRVGTATWLAVAAAASALVYANARTPLHLKWCWPFVVAALALSRWAGLGERRPRLALVSGFVLTAVYLGGLEWCARTAVANALAKPPSWAIRGGIHAGAVPRFVMRSPSIADPFHWTLCFETDDIVRWNKVGLDGRPVRDDWHLFDIDKNLDDPLVRRAMELPEASAWRYFARVPTAWTERGGDGRDHVFLSDARYQWGRGLSWCVVEVDLPPDDGAAAGAAVDSPPNETRR